jgi:hypothetical protein
MYSVFNASFSGDSLYNYVRRRYSGADINVLLLFSFLLDSFFIHLPHHLARQISTKLGTRAGCLPIYFKIKITIQALRGGNGRQKNVVTSLFLYTD